MSPEQDLALFNYQQFQALADKAAKAGEHECAQRCQANADHWWAQAGLS